MSGVCEKGEPVKLAWAAVAHPDHPYGYGVINKRLSLALSQAGATILPGRAFGWDAVVAVALPLAWLAGPDVIFHTMYECRPLPPDWGAVGNRCGAVWVTSQFCYDLFREAGVSVPMFVSGYGIDPEIFRPSARPSASVRGGGPMRFLVWGRGMVSRKNVLLAARAFLAAALPPYEAVLEIKVNDHFASEGMIFKDAQGKAIPNIHVVAGDWTDTQMANWLGSGDCMIYLSAGEGYGLMPLEAMATGMPLICAYNTGMMTYLTPENALLVPTVGQEVSQNYTQRFGVESTWCKPDFEAAVNHIRWVFENREAAYAIGRRAAADAAKLTWEAAGRRALVEIQAHYGRPEHGHAGG